jgi:hypothetical protein
MANLTQDEIEQGQVPARRAFWRRRWVRWAASLLGLAVVAFAAATVYLARHLEPILRASVVKALSERFHSPVELDRLGLSIGRGIEVRGDGLRILYLAGPTMPDKQQLAGQGGSPPMVSVRSFRFRVTRHDLITMHARVARVQVEGMELHIPPHRLGQAFHPAKERRPTVMFEVGRIECRDTRLFIETLKPGKEPLEFDIQDLTLTDVGPGRPMLYVADVVNPKPKGDIHAFGHLGPWVGEDPRATPLDGDYRFDHVDLGTINGLGGTLASVGHYAGALGHLTVDGTANVPDLSLDVSGHAVPLQTTFHAFVDGMNGDTTLAPVQARLLHTDITAQGTIAKTAGNNGKGGGHDIALTVDLPNGRIEDLLQLGMKTMPPVMRGAVTLRAKLHIPPGDVRVAQKLELAGNLRIAGVVFGNPKLQDRVDGLSMRAQGRPEESRTASSDRSAEVRSEMSATFALAHSQMMVDKLHYEMPGAKVDMAGAYTMDGSLFEFKGHVRTEARASQMVTGWRSMLLKPFDKMLARDGAGLQLPVEVSGAKGDVRFGLAMHGADESSKEMAEELKRKQEIGNRK